MEGLVRIDRCFIVWATLAPAPDGAGGDGGVSAGRSDGDAIQFGFSFAGEPRRQLDPGGPAAFRNLSGLENGDPRWD